MKTQKVVATAAAVPLAVTGFLVSASIAHPVRHVIARETPPPKLVAHTEAAPAPTAIPRMPAVAVPVAKKPPAKPKIASEPKTNTPPSGGNKTTTTNTIKKTSGTTTEKRAPTFQDKEVPGAGR